MKKYKLVIPGEIFKEDAELFMQIRDFDGCRIISYDKNCSTHGKWHARIDDGEFSHRVPIEWLKEVKEPMSLDECITELEDGCCQNMDFSWQTNFRAGWCRALEQDKIRRGES